MIFTKRKITINGDKASMDKQIVLYRGDREVEVQFEIVYEVIKYRMSNTIEDVNASFGQLVIQNNSAPSPTVTDISPTSEGVVIFKFTKEMIDEINELGEYSFQIRLFDNTRTSRITTPIIENGIVIKEPLSIYEGDIGVDTAEVGLALTGTARVQQEEYLEPFDETGNYNETTWSTGDIITSGKLNKLEDGITGVNRKIDSQINDIANNFSTEETDTNIILKYNGVTILTVPLNGISTPDVPVNIPVTGVTLDKSSGNITVGDTLTLTATVSPDNATNKTIVWNSNNPIAASVANGVVTGNEAGSATITVMTQDGRFTATCNVTVTDTSTNISVISVTLNKTSSTVNLATTEKLTATVSPNNATNKELVWSVGDGEYIAVTNNGTVIPKKAGTGQVVVKTMDGGYSSYCNYTITNIDIPNPVFELNANNYSSNASTWTDSVGGKIATLTSGCDKVDNRVRIKNSTSFSCNISSLGISDFTIILKLLVNPTGANISSNSGNNIICIGVGTTDWTNNMTCTIFPTYNNTAFAPKADNYSYAQNDETVGEQYVILRHDSANSKVYLNIGKKKAEYTYTSKASALTTLYCNNSTFNDYSYIKIYNSVLTDEQISAFLNKDGFIADSEGKYKSAWSDFSVKSSYLSTLTGKKIAQFGDSLMAGAGNNNNAWGYYFDLFYGTTTTNYSIGGATVVEMSGRSLISQQISGATLSDTDYVLINGGINDCWNTATNTASVVRAIESNINALISKGIAKKNIVYVLPAGFTATDTVRYYNETISKLKAMGIKYIELRKYIGTSHTTDGIHYNSDGYMATLNPIASLLCSTK